MDTVWLVHNQSYGENTIYFTKEGMLERLKKDAEDYSQPDMKFEVFGFLDGHYAIGIDQADADNDPVVTAYELSDGNTV